MSELSWSSAEKKIARAAFDAALDKELAALLHDFKRRAAEASDVQQLWAIEDFLRDQRREIGYKYDYRYSQLIRVFGLLLREGWLQEQQLEGLREDKLEMIRRWAFL
jgi:Photoprotection regulator fluorescence recovery protein